MSAVGVDGCRLRQASPVVELRRKRPNVGVSWRVPHGSTCLRKVNPSRLRDGNSPPDKTTSGWFRYCCVGHAQQCRERIEVRERRAVER